MDDILRSAKSNDIDKILVRVNKLHPNLEFTIERQESGCLPFLDMMVKQADNHVETSWYRKPTDTGLTLSYRALAPMRYKQNIVQGTVHRIFHASSNWHFFTEGIIVATHMLEKNQYPSQFYEPIIRKTLNKIIEQPVKQCSNTTERLPKKRTPFVMQYRGNKSDVFSKRLQKTANISVIFTTRQLRTALPSLKAKIPEMVRSNVVYEIL